MKQYTTPDITLVSFSTQDVITASRLVLMDTAMKENETTEITVNYQDAFWKN